MVENNKDLLDLEANPASSSTLESKLFVCNKNGRAPPPPKKPTMSPLPKSQVLGKVKDFLGVFSESNKKLVEAAKERPESYDIEVLSGNESKYIEMDLMLGIADLHTPEAVAAAECAMAGYQKPNHLSSNEDSSDDDDENQKQSEHGLKAAQRDSSCQESKKQKPKKRPKIVEMFASLVLYGWFPWFTFISTSNQARICCYSECFEESKHRSLPRTRSFLWQITECKLGTGSCSLGSIRCRDPQFSSLYNNKVCASGMKVGEDGD